MSPALDAFCRLYQSLSPAQLDGLRRVYSQDVLFADPAHDIRGIDALVAYFEGLFARVKQCRFDIIQVMEQDGEAYVRWEMHFIHPSLNHGRPVSVPGVSHLCFADRVFYHRDFFDLGTMLYERLPLLGSCIRALKRRLNS
ncbi:nuclear transport factor 2 family protein [Oceanimonas pelagia]|uniref:Nuclear transport factor 2 family protein n=1 Tax=Oceanimonas pelagia TaxID=3028314 RepID=A0AA50Q927_9GAMM|nr:nuclear transport factor 2 family protein [Oceanimonas pelagia]WMC09368.1 nuclear transport factor 2 family protein [Oceanimonas pelagia]